MTSSRPEQEPSYEPPSLDDSKTLWRYMDFPKYMSLVSEETVWFSNAKELIDPYEGILPEQNAEMKKQSIMSETDKRESYARRIVNALSRYTGTYLISCWSNKNHQSAALWDLYSDNNQGIAVKTSAGQLLDSLEDNPHEFYSGLVRYIDYSNDSIPNEQPSSIYHKRKSFSHEDEYRLAIKGSITDDNGIAPSGVPISADIETLIDEVYVHPLAESWFYELVQNLSPESVSDSVKQSSLFDDPIE